MKFRPLHDRVVVERLEAEEKTASGIIIPDSAQEKPMQGKIVAAGSGARDETGKIQPLDVKEGDVNLISNPVINQHNNAGRLQTTLRTPLIHGCHSNAIFDLTRPP